LFANNKKGSNSRKIKYKIHYILLRRKIEIKGVKFKKFKNESCINKLNEFYERSFIKKGRN